MDLVWPVVQGLARFTHPLTLELRLHILAYLQAMRRDYRKVVPAVTPAHLFFKRHYVPIRVVLLAVVMFGSYSLVAPVFISAEALEAARTVFVGGGLSLGVTIALSLVLMFAMVVKKQSKIHLVADHTAAQVHDTEGRIFQFVFLCHVMLLINEAIQHKDGAYALAGDVMSVSFTTIQTAFVMGLFQNKLKVDDRVKRKMRRLFGLLLFVLAIGNLLLWYYDLLEASSMHVPLRGDAPLTFEQALNLVLLPFSVEYHLFVCMKLLERAADCWFDMEKDTKPITYKTPLLAVSGVSPSVEEFLENNTTDQTIGDDFLVIPPAPEQ